MIEKKDLLLDKKAESLPEKAAQNTALSPQNALQLQSAEIGLPLAVGTVSLLRGLSLFLETGKVYYLAGENGSGKTTFLRTLVGEIPLLAGEMKWFFRPNEIGYMPQQLALSSVVPATVEDVLLYNGDRPTHKRKQTVQEWIDRLNLRSLLKRRYAHLSMGQQKRVLFGRAMISVPRFLVLDEPLANLDATTKEILMNVLNNYCRQNQIGMLITSHDPHWLENPIVLSIHSQSIMLNERVSKPVSQDRFGKRTDV